MLINFVDATNDANHYTKPPKEYWTCTSANCIQQLLQVHKL